MERITHHIRTRVDNMTMWQYKPTEQRNQSCSCWVGHRLCNRPNTHTHTHIYITQSISQSVRTTQKHSLMALIPTNCHKPDMAI